MADLDASLDPEPSAADNALPDPALFSGGFKKKKKRGNRELDDGGGLSITSLMDVLTIILVFLLKNFSTSPVQLKESKDLKLPASSSDLIPADSTAITVTLRYIMVDDDTVVSLEDGKVPPGALDPSGLLIEPLLERLRESVTLQKRIATRNKKAEFKGICTVVADRHATFDLVRQVMYTAGLAEYGQFKFAVIKFKT